MSKKTKMKCGAIVRDVPKGSIKWYVAAGWKVIEDKKPKEGNENDETDSEKTSTT